MRFWFSIVNTLSMIMGLLCGATALAQDYRELAKLTASDGVANQHFGCSVSMFADMLVVGAYGDASAGTDTGAAYVYQRSGDDEWTEVAKLTAGDGAADDSFGLCVSGSGDTIVAGAEYHYAGASEAGAAYVFERSADGWAQVAKLTAPDGAALDHFGHCVAVDGAIIFVGAPWDDDLGYASGSVYVFEKMGDTWTQTAKLTASDGTASFGANFGWSVAISGDTAVIGAHHGDDGGVASGSAYVFEKISGTWTETAKLTPTGEIYDQAHFGVSVAISGEAILVSAYYDDELAEHAGSVFFFENIEGTWTQVAKRTASDGAEYDLFGMWVSICGDTAAVGAMKHDEIGVGINSGAAYVFERTGGEWMEVDKLIPSDLEAYDLFGVSVAVDDGEVAVGSYYDDDLGDASGSAYVFGPDESSEDVRYTIVDLGTMGGNNVYPRDVNASGEVAGFASTGTLGQHAFLWSESGGFTDCGTLGFDYSYGYGCNSAGAVVGKAIYTINGDYHAFFWSSPAGPIQDMGTLGGVWSAAYDINDTGQAVGWAHIAGSSYRHAFMWQQGSGMVDLGTGGRFYSHARAINNAIPVQVAGDTSWSGESDTIAFIWTDGVFTDLPAIGGAYSEAVDLNDLGQVVGWSVDASGNWYATLWNAGGGPAINLGALGGNRSQAQGINNLGHVVGWAKDAAGQDRAFLYKNGEMLDLSSLIRPDAGWNYLREAEAINDAGQITGFGYLEGTTYERGFLLTPCRTGDLDCDGDVDLDDFNIFAGCLTGPNGGVDSGCDTSDLNGDGDVDLLDFASFAVLFGG